MIADDRDHPIEWAVKVITMPIWGQCYLAGNGAVKVWKALPRRKPNPEPQQVEILQPVWTPVSDLERTVYAAMIFAGRPVTNAELAHYERVGRRGEPQGESPGRRAPQGANRMRGEDQPAACTETTKPRRSDPARLFSAGAWWSNGQHPTAAAEARRRVRRQTVSQRNGLP